jgi:hypothetical protein
MSCWPDHEQTIGERPEQFQYIYISANEQYNSFSNYFSCTVRRRLQADTIPNPGFPAVRFDKRPKRLAEMRKVTLFDKLKYWFDNVMAKGAIVLNPLADADFAAGRPCLFGQYETDRTSSGRFRGDRGSFSDLFWMNLSTVLEPGLAEGGSWTFKLENFTVAMMGILLVSTLIGLITAGIEIGSSSCAKDAPSCSNRSACRSSWAGLHRFSPSWLSWSSPMPTNGAL